MGLPKLTVNKVVGNSGALNPPAYGTTLFVITAPAAYTATAHKFVQLSDVEAAGITEANDDSNNALVWEHLKDFYRLAPAGTVSHLLLLADTVTLTNCGTTNNAAYTAIRNKLAAEQGAIKMVVFAVNPAASETGTNSISADLNTAIPLFEALAGVEATALRPIHIIAEGRRFTGTSANATNLRGLTAGSVTVMCARDKDRADALATPVPLSANYAAVGLLAGKVASVHVGRNVGRVLSGPLPVTTPQFSGGQLLYTGFTETDLDVINDKGYCFFVKHPGVSGVFFNDDPTCISITKSNSSISANRAQNKAIDIVVQTYAQRLKDEIFVDGTTGRLAPAFVAGFQNELAKAITDEMIANPDPTREREISAVTVFVDPNQNVLSTSKVVVQLSIVPLGVLREIVVNVELTNPGA